jgi:DNA polymerase
MNICHLDLESYSECDLLQCGAAVYAQHPTTEVLCMSFVFNDDRTVVNWHPKTLGDYSDFPSRVRNHIENGGIITAHNASFEWSMFKYTLGIEIDPRQFRDTQLQAAVNALPQGLGNCCDAIGSHPKDETGRRIMLQLCKPKKASKIDPTIRFTPGKHPDKFQTLYHYCNDDVYAQRGIYDKIPKPTEDEQKLYELVFIAGAKGLPIDKDSIPLMLDVIEKEKVRLYKRFNELTGLEPTQVGKIRQWLEDDGLELPNTQAATLVQTLLREDISDVQREVIIIRQSAGKSSTAKYQKFFDTCCSDNTAKFTMVAHGAKTGRTTGAGAQTSNLPRPTEKCPELVFEAARLDILDITYKTVMSAASSGIRSLIKAPEEYGFRQGDYSQIEARVLAWGAGQDDALERFRKGKDPYIALAAKIYHMPIEKVGKDSIERQISKSAVLGAGFQLGGKSFVAYCAQSGIVIEKKEAIRVIEIFRKENPKIVAFWKEAQQCAVDAILDKGVRYKYKHFSCVFKGDFLRIQLPSGREISYYKPGITYDYVDRKKWPDWKPPKIHYMGVNATTKQFCRMHTYGGDLVQGWTQATARDILMDAWTRANGEGWDVRLTVYDELLCVEPNGGRTHGDLCKLMVEPPLWAVGLPIAADGWTGNNYRK